MGEAMAKVEVAHQSGHRRHTFGGSLDSSQASPASNEEDDVFSRLTDRKNFTGIHRQQEEAKAKAEAKEKEKLSIRELERAKVEKVDKVKVKVEEDPEAVPALGGDGGVFARLANPASFTGTQAKKHHPPASSDTGDGKTRQSRGCDSIESEAKDEKENDSVQIVEVE